MHGLDHDNHPIPVPFAVSTGDLFAQIEAIEAIVDREGDLFDLADSVREVLESGA